MDSPPKEAIIKNVTVTLSGFTKNEIKDIVGYIRSVRARMSLEEATRLLKELWPEQEGPPFMATFKRAEE